MFYTYLVWYWACYWNWWWIDCYLYNYTVNVLLWVGYPCPTHNSGFFWWFWMSEKIPNDKSQKEITFRWQFDDLRRVKYLFVTFMTTP